MWHVDFWPGKGGEPRGGQRGVLSVGNPGGLWDKLISVVERGASSNRLKRRKASVHKGQRKEEEGGVK